MRVQIVKLEASHLEHLLAQKYMAPMRGFITTERAEALARAKHTYTAVTAAGKIVGCGGVHEIWPGRAEVWTVLDRENSRPHDFLAFHRAVGRFLDELPVRRLEASVEVEHEEGHRWMELLGFELETPVAKAFKPDGKDCSLYARVKHV